MGLVQGLVPLPIKFDKLFPCAATLATCSESLIRVWLATFLQAEFARVPLADTTVVAVPERVTDIEALMLGDILPTGRLLVHLGALQNCRHGSICVGMKPLVNPTAIA